MLKTPRSFFYAGGLAALVVLASLTACGKGGCGNCSLPPFFTATTAPTTIATIVPVIIPTVVPTVIAGIPTTVPTIIPTLIPTVLPTVIPTVVPTAIPTAVAIPTPVPAPPPPSCSQGGASIALGPALAPFAVLAGSTVTNVGNTLITYAPGATTGILNDDLVGVSPGTAVTGFYPPGTVSDGPSAIYGAGYNPIAAVPLAAQLALTTAYNTAAGRAATTTFAGSQDLSLASVPGFPVGTLPAGVYKSPSSLSIASGNLTLDGGGNPQSVFIFQTTASTLTTTLNGAASGNVNLQNGASACNIYWQVGSSATLGGATFYGNVLANQSITINATRFTGRALASVGAVSIPVATGSLITNPGGN